MIEKVHRKETTKFAETQHPCGSLLFLSQTGTQYCISH